MPDQKSQFAEGVLECCVLTALVTAPLYVNLYSALPFEEAKVPLLRSIALVALPFFVFVLIKRGLGERSVQKTGNVWGSPLVVPALIVGYAYLVSTVFSVSPAGSFFGMYLRRQGMYTGLCYLLFFFVVLGMPRTRQQIERLLFTVVLAGFIVAVWAILQSLGLERAMAAGFGGRPWSTLGNPIFLSSFLIMTVPIHFYFLDRMVKRLRERRLDGIPLKNSRTEVLFFGLILVFLVINLTSIVLSQSRGPVLGLGAGLFFFAVVYLLGRGHARTVAACLVGGAVLLFLLVLLNLPDQRLATFSGMPHLARLGSVFQFGSGLVRASIWKGVYALLGSDPVRILVGYGPESLSLMLPMHTPPLLRYITKPTAMPDRAHNELLDLLAMEGILGLAAFLFFFGAVTRFVLRQLGLIRSTRQDRAFCGLLPLCGLLGGLASSIATKDVTFSALGFGIGFVGGLFCYLLFFALTMNKGALSPRHPDGLLLSALLAALVAHFVEIQFFFGVTATRLYFWVFAALAIVAGKIRGGEAGEPGGLSRQGFLFSPSAVIPAFLAGLVLATVTYDYAYLSKTNPRFLLAVFGCHVCIFVACALFCLAQLRDQTRDAHERVRGLTAYMVLALALSAAYVLSYFLLEKNLARLLYHVLRGPVLPVLEQNIRFTFFCGWILVFVFVSSYLLVFGNELKKQRRTALKASWVFPLLILLVLPALIATNLRNPVADIYTKTGEQMMRAKHWGVAQRCFSKAISLEPNQAWRHEKLGFLYFAQAKAAKEPEKNLYFQKAIYHGQKATHLSPLDRALKSNLARMSSVWAADAKDGKMRFYRLKVTDTLYMEALEAEPNNSLLWKESAQIAAALGQTNVAVQRFQRVLKLHRNDFESHRNLALLYRSLKHYPEALAHAEAALRLASEKQRTEIERLVEELKEKTH